MIKRILTRAALSALLLLCLIKLSAQEINAENVDQYQSKTDSLAKSGAHVAAYEGYNLLATYYLSTSNTGAYLEAKKTAIQALIALSQLEEAGNELKSFIAEIKDQYPDQYEHLSNGYRIKGDLESIYQRNPVEGLVSYREALAVLENNVPQAYTVMAKIYVKVANVQFEMNRPDSATYYFTEGIALFREEPGANATDIALTYRQLGVINYFQGNIDQTLAYSYKGLKEIDPENEEHLNAFSDIYLLLGNIHKNINDYDSAFYYMNAAQDINLRTLAPDDSRIAEAYQNLATLATRRNNYGMAEEMLLKAREIALKHPEKDRVLLVYIYNLLGNVVKQLYNSNQQAVDYYNEALSLLGDSDDPRSINIRCSISLNKASVHQYSVFSYDRDTSPQFEASLKNQIQQLSEAKDLAENVLNLPPARLSTYYLNLAFMYSVHDDLEQSEAHFRKVIALQAKIPTPNNAVLGAAYGAIGYIKLKLQDLQGFREFSLVAEEHLGKATRTDTGDLSSTYNTLASRYLEVGQYTDVERLLDKAIEVNQPFSRQATSKNSLKDVINNFQYSRTLFMSARAMELTAREASNTGQMEEALKRYRELSAFLLETLTDKRESKDIVNNASLYHAAFHGYTATCYYLYQAKGDQEYVTEAFEASQLSRAILLKRALFDKNLKSFNSLPKEVLARENEFESSISYLQSQIKQETSGSDARRAKEEALFLAKQERNSLLSTLIEEYPEYYNLKYTTERVALNEITASLKPDESLVEYILGNDVLYGFVINQEGLKIEEINVGLKLDSLIGSMNYGIQKSDQEQYQKAARELYTTIFKPLEKHLTGNRIKVVPDGPLWNLNLDLLISDKTDDDKPAYLIKEYAFSYAYSAVSLRQQKTNQLKRGLAAFSFGDIQDIQPRINTLRNTPVDLPGSALEVFNLSQRFDGEYFYGKESTEARFKEVAGDFSVLHLAVHGEIDEEDYDNSRLYFKANENDSTEDNLLYPFELYNMDLNANLVVLSACNSGSGTVARGEGTMSLGRAFRYAGVNSLLLTKWEVSDGIAPEIISDFYNHLEEGMTKDEALRAAKLRFLESADNITNNPFYWGSFYILGDSKPIAINAGINYVQIGIIFCLFIFSVMVAFRVRMKKNMHPDS